MLYILDVFLFFFKENKCFYETHDFTLFANVLIWAAERVDLSLGQIIGQLSIISIYYYKEEVMTVHYCLLVYNKNCNHVLGPKESLVFMSNSRTDFMDFGLS